jgi:hypothetical protein
MLIWGSKGEVADLGVQATHNCPTCERDRPFKLALQYKVHHIWYLFKWVTQKQYMLVCDVCQRGAKLEAKEVEPKLARHPVPFLSRYGWTFLAALVVVVIAFSSLEGHQRDTRTAELLGAPRVNDLYVVNVAKLLKDPDSSFMYGVMRVRSVRGGEIEFDVPGVTYNKASGATKDISRGKVASPDYFAPKTLVLPVAEVQALRADGAIYLVERS